MRTPSSTTPTSGFRVQRVRGMRSVCVLRHISSPILLQLLQLLQRSIPLYDELRRVHFGRL